MKYVKQFLIIVLFTALGQIPAALIPFPIPASIYGFVLLFLALCLGIVKPAQIEQTANFLISILGLLVVPSAVNLLAYYDVIVPAWVPICVILLVTTVLTFAVSGLVTQWIGRKGEDNG